MGEHKNCLHNKSFGSDIFSDSESSSMSGRVQKNMTDCKYNKILFLWTDKVGYVYFDSFAETANLVENVILVKNGHLT
jgi:hypothetical protein